MPSVRWRSPKGLTAIIVFWAVLGGLGASFRMMRLPGPVSFSSVEGVALG
jgi:hypothetical protein